MSSLAIEGRHRVGVAAELPGVLRDLGADPQALLARADLDSAVLDDPENGISFHALGCLLEVCVAATGRQDLGLLLGGRGGTGHLGLVGTLMRNAPTLGAAVLDLCTNQHRYIRGAVAYLEVSGKSALWGYGVHLPGTPAVEQISDAALAIGARMLHELVGRSANVVYVSRQAPRDAAAFRRVFGSTPEFNAEQYALEFPSDWLSLPVAGADPQLRRDAERMVENYWAAIFPNFTERASRSLRSRVICGDASIEAVAESLSLTVRTLNRRLRAEGRTFREISNDARYVVAQQMLACTRMPITDIALALGYADTSGFTRAFRRAAGRSPSEWRVQV
jgi:AraC-like DNA-binding protein